MNDAYLGQRDWIRSNIRKQLDRDRRTRKDAAAGEDAIGEGASGCHVVWQ